MNNWWELPWLTMIHRPEWAAAVSATQRKIRHRLALVTVDGAEIMDIPFTGGSVTASFDATTTYSVTFTVEDPDWMPIDSNSELDTRAGYQVQAWWGVWVDEAGKYVEVPIGLVNPEDPSIDQSAAGIKCSITGADNLNLARRTDYGVTTVYVGGSSIDEAIKRLFDKISDAPLRIGQTDVTMPLLYSLGEQTPAEDWETLAAMAGWEVWCDPDGALVAGEIPEQLRGKLTGGDGCSVLATNVKRRTSEIYNVVYVVGTNPDVNPPCWGMAEDDDEGSPTWVGGPLGRRTKTLETDKVASNEAARSRAKRELRKWLKPTATVSIQMRQRGDLIYGDQLRLAFPESGIHGKYRVSGWSLPLTPPGEAFQPMTVQFYEKRGG